ncbi:hypothetical protein BV22DRAFT_1132481 [Leucogyrophana mollusca]|uniref:Uncharacterized protein n=1 Tax=Leucogyrophana mollusca TaxID=85980 RepID=A0ACB8B8V7_9AGAM|nr:hypothetical protein BV22DRAFT_1132481 [Leucogyrophana mollusca]
MSRHGNIDARSSGKLHRKAAQDIWARFSASYPNEEPTGSPSAGLGPASAKPSSAPATSAAILKTSTTTTSSSSSSTSSSTSTSTTSSSSSTISSSSALSSISTLSTPAYTPPPPRPSTSNYRSATGLSLAPSSSTSAAASATPTGTSTISTGLLVGGIAGGLVGLAIIGFALMFCLRKCRKGDDYEDDFNASAFKRQSAILVDDPVPPPQSYNPRPPSMIERKMANASPALARQKSYGQNYYGGYGGYGQQSYQAPPPMPAAYQQPAMGYNDPSQLARQPSHAAYLNRQPSAGAPYASPVDPSAHYVDLDRSSVTPFQAAQYADISRQLNSYDPHMAAPHADEDDFGPLPSPFDDVAHDDGHHTTDAVPRAPSPVHLQESAPHEGDAIGTAVTSPDVGAPRAREAPSATKRPDTVYTVYGDGDAYDGI